MTNPFGGNENFPPGVSAGDYEAWLGPQDDEVEVELRDLCRDNDVDFDSLSEFAKHQLEFMSNKDREHMMLEIREGA